MIRGKSAFRGNGILTPVVKSRQSNKKNKAVVETGAPLKDVSATKCWLMKSEPDVFGLDDLKKKTTKPWDGVRNYQARNHMKDMKFGDRVLFYHSNSKPSGVVGTATVCKEHYADFTAWKKKGRYYDPKASPVNPIWQMVDVKYGSHFKQIVSLDDCKQYPELKEMVLLKSGLLSVQPVTAKEYDFIVSKGNDEEAAEGKMQDLLHAARALGGKRTKVISI